MTSPILSGRIFATSRGAALGCVALALCACSSSPDSDGPSALDIARSLWQGASGSSAVTLKEAGAIPYASIGYKVGGNSEQLLVLWNALGPTTVWTSASRVVLVLRGGRLVETVGLQRNLSQLNLLDSGSAVLQPIAQGKPANYSWKIDLADMNIYGAMVSCRASRAGSETISILGTAISTVRVEETCDCPSLDWSFTNKYWLDSSTGRVWRTIQTISPKLDPVEIQILRPTG